jgi:hypothetical protein
LDFGFDDLFAEELDRRDSNQGVQLEWAEFSGICRDISDSHP